MDLFRSNVTSEQSHTVTIQIENSNIELDSSKDLASGSDPNDLISKTCASGCCEQEPVNDFIYRRGFLEGACSDITVKAFNQEYKLHKLILDRSGYFSMLFNGPWNDPSRTVHELRFEDDEYISKEAFEIAIGILYGAKKSTVEQHQLRSLIAVGQFLDIQPVVCAATSKIISSLDFENIASYSYFAVSNNYGSASDKILDSVKGLLCAEGWELGVKYWDGIPCSVIASIVGLDSFYIWSEWERVVFTIKLIERRQKRKNSTKYNHVDVEGIELIRDTLNDSIHFCHLTAEQLHRLQDWKDITGEPFVRQSVLKDALWMSVSLHQKVATTPKHLNELGLAVNSDRPPDGKSSWFIPVNDNTIYGTPDILNKQILEQQQQYKEKEYEKQDDVSSKITENGDSQSYRVTKIPPFRFSIGFNDISEVDLERRVYGRTLWYAGSYWNLYVQKIKHKKGYQMGVYVHRASSATPSKSGLLNHDVSSRDSQILSSDSEVGEILSRVNNLGFQEDFGIQPSATFSESNSLEASDEYVTKPLNDDQYDVDYEDEEDEQDEDTSGDFEIGERSFLSYEDNRSNTSVYCVIYTPSSKVKSSLTCFMSRPELFKKSQSWGWKSNSMCLFNEDGTLSEGQDKILKFMVVLGNV